jgi:hypothetical protein
MVIWKYPVGPGPSFHIDIPKSPEILTVQLQDGVPMLWVIVDPHSHSVRYHFNIRPTGGEHDGISVQWAKDRYVATYQLIDGTVWHLFHAL